MLCVDFRGAVLGPHCNAGSFHAQGRSMEFLDGRDEVTCAALIRWAMRQSFCHMEGAESILHSGSRAASFWLSYAMIQNDCALNFQVQRRRCIDLCSGSQAASFQLSGATIFSSLGSLCVVSGRLCVDFCHTRSFLEEKKYFWH
ncbi:hypothetical protein NDU88_002595 [Pleurodeles waltl]|uniref:Uncharacterized protein n=1 Tax=Pleurodeles waltl TaxID=8319 RepID=A0AAV7KW32_PLEWA|nr:hypothetical protein NDU88_002595 [Pleurodeles waltl]